MGHTDEQQLVIEADGQTILVIALAGTGKTTTLVGYTVARPAEHFLYIAFNKAIQLEGAARFPKNVTCLTTHSLAYRAFGFNYKSKLGNPRFWDVKDLLGANLANDWSNLVLQAVANFHSSADEKITKAHFPVAYVVPANLAEAKAREEALIRDAGRVWAAMQDTESAMPMPHDGYLKLYQLSKPDLSRYGTLLFDEAQDSNPVTADIVMGQKGRKILVGDHHQSIYQFRGAQNAMKNVKADQSFYLTKSFRFGEGVAWVANRILENWKGERHSLRGVGKYPDTEFELPRNEGYAAICRTNAKVFELASEALKNNKHVCFVGGPEGYKLESILDAYRLFLGDLDQIKDRYFKRFEKWDTFVEYASATEDPEAVMLSRIVGIYNHDIPGLIELIRRKGKTFEKGIGADLILTTAHKSKGLEFENVLLTDDYVSFFDQDGDLRRQMDESEVNLLYVAVTRAEKAIQLNETTLEWLRHIGETLPLKKGSASLRAA